MKKKFSECCDRNAGQKWQQIIESLHLRGETPFGAGLLLWGMPGAEYSQICPQRDSEIKKKPWEV